MSTLAARPFVCGPGRGNRFLIGVTAPPGQRQRQKFWQTPRPQKDTSLFP